MNDIFSPDVAGAVAASSAAPAVIPAPAGIGPVVSSAAAPGSSPAVGQGPPIKVGAAPVALLMTPNGRTVYVADEGSGTVIPIDVASGRPGSPITVGAAPTPSR